MSSFIIHNNKEIKGFFGSYRFLSNFHGAWVWSGTGGRNFHSVEPAYQFAKFSPTIMISYDKTYNEVRQMEVGEVKRWGRELKEIKPNWDDLKYNIMQQLVMDKFSRHLQLREMLL